MQMRRMSDQDERIREFCIGTFIVGVTILLATGRQSLLARLQAEQEARGAERDAERRSERENVRRLLLDAPHADLGIPVQ